MKMRIAVVGCLVASTLVVAAPSAHAGSDCSYDDGTETVIVLPGGASRTKLFVDSGNEIKATFDGAEFDCGDATTGNTSTIVIDASPADEVLMISQNGAGGRFPTTVSFIVQAEGGTDFFRLIGSSGPDSFRFGVDPADAGVTPAADLYGSGEAAIRLFEIEFLSARMLGGNDSVTGRPGAGFDGPLVTPLDAAGQGGRDTVIGGSVADNLTGGRGADAVKGLAGADFLIGGAGDDALNGGPGGDTCSGGPGDDTLRRCEIGGD